MIIKQNKDEEILQEYLDSLKTELNLDFSKILKSDDTFYSMKSLFNNEAIFIYRIKCILDDKNLTLEQKQFELENLSHELQNPNTGLNYYLSGELKDLIVRIDKFAFDPSHFSSLEPTSFLPHNIWKGLSTSSDEIKVTYKTEARIRLIKIFKIILISFKQYARSFGLFLVYNVTTILRERTFDKNKDFITKDTAVRRSISVKPNLTVLKRLDLVSNLGKRFFDIFSILDRLTTRNTSEDNSKSIPDRDLLLNYLKDDDIIDLLRLSSEVNSKDFAELGLICVTFLEASGLLNKEDIYNISTTTKPRRFAYATVSSTYETSIFSIPTNPKSLPLLVNPMDWEHSAGSDNIHFGGFLLNKTLNFPGVFNIRNKGVVNLRLDELESINYLQSNYYRINKTFLDLILEDPHIFLRQYFFSRSPQSIDILTLISKKYFSLKTLMEFKASSKDYNDSVIKQVPVDEMFKLEFEVYNKYMNYFSFLISFIQAYKLAQLYKDFKFYFTIYLDSRGRFYYSNTGGYFGLQSGGFSKCLIELKGNTYFPFEGNKYLKLPIKSTVTPSLKKSIIKDLKNSVISFDEISAKITSSTICVDASCSGSSIISALIGDVSGLLATNVLIKEEGSEKKCIYNHFSKRLEYFFEMFFSTLFSSYIIQNLSAITKLSSSDINNFLEYFKILINDIFLREHTKHFVMCINYSESRFGRSKYIIDFIVIPSSLKNLEQHRSVVVPHLKAVKYLCNLFADWVLKVYDLTFREMSNFCKFLLKKIDHKRPVILTSPSFGSFQYTQVAYKEVRTYRPHIHPEAKNKELSYYIPTTRVDVRKGKRAFLANYIHYLDSRLCSYVISCCRVNKICLYTNHDSFYVSSLYSNEVLTFYFNGIKLILSEDFVGILLKSNSVVLTSTDLEYLSEISSNKALLLNKINNEELKMSPFILS